VLVTVGRYINPVEAHIAKGRLEAEGITAYVQHEHHVWANWPISQALGYVKVQVNAEDIEVSRTVLEKCSAGEYALTENADDDNVTRCPQCGGTEIRRSNWRWKLALWGAVLVSVAIPYTIYRVECVSCHHAWKQKA